MIQQQIEEMADVTHPVIPLPVPQKIHDRITITEGHWIWGGGKARAYPYVFEKDAEGREIKVDLRRKLWQLQNGPLRTRRLFRQCGLDACVNPDHQKAR